MVRFALGVGLVVVLWGCGGTTEAPTCQMTCAGCCYQDECVPFVDQNAGFCGTAGVECSSCGPNAQCTEAGCQPTDACGAQNGGCDANATCSQIGVRVMCTCGPGFVGDGFTCTPRLSSLYLSEGYLSPVFSPERSSYIAVLPAGTLEVTLTAGSQAMPVFFEIDGVQGPMRTVPITASAQEVVVRVTATLTQRSWTVRVQLQTASTTLQQRGYLKPTGTRAGMGFAKAIAVSGDGQTIAVGAQNDEGVGLRSGRVYVFKKGATAWAQEAVLSASNAAQYDGFGTAVALSTDGNTLLVGAPGEDGAMDMEPETGAGYVFRRTGTTWTEEAILRARVPRPGDSVGWSASLSGDGATAVLGAPFDDTDATGINGAVGSTTTHQSSGAAHVYTFGGGAWTHVAYVKANNTGAGDNFGKTLALSRSGQVLAVGAENEDSDATTINGDGANNRGSARGAVYAYRIAAGTVSFDGYLKAPNSGDADRFGAALALSDDGAVLAVGAPGESGEGVGVSTLPDNNGVATSGAVYVFRKATAWAFDAYLKTTNSGVGDAAGTSVALRGDGALIAIGAPGEDSDATGVESNLTNEDAQDSGAVFLFVYSGGTWTRGVTVKASNTGTGDAFGAKLAAGTDTMLVAAPGEDSNATMVDGDQANNDALESGAAFVFTP
ncbi:MAG: EGF domain-containing protein [Myxococcota bacterium]